MSTLEIVLLVIFGVMVVLGLIRNEAGSSGFWFKLLVGVAILALGGIPGLGH